MNRSRVNELVTRLNWLNCVYPRPYNGLLTLQENMLLETEYLRSISELFWELASASYLTSNPWTVSFSMPDYFYHEDGYWESTTTSERGVSLLNAQPLIHTSTLLNPIPSRNHILDNFPLCRLNGLVNGDFLGQWDFWIEETLSACDNLGWYCAWNLCEVFEKKREISNGEIIESDNQIELSTSHLNNFGTVQVCNFSRCDYINVSYEVPYLYMIRYIRLTNPFLFPIQIQYFYSTEFDTTSFIISELGDMTWDYMIPEVEPYDASYMPLLINSIQNAHVATSAPVTVGAGETITIGNPTIKDWSVTSVWHTLISQNEYDRRTVAGGEIKNVWVIYRRAN